MPLQASSSGCSLLRWRLRHDLLLPADSSHDARFLHGNWSFINAILGLCTATNTDVAAASLAELTAVPPPLFARYSIPWAFTPT